MKEQEALEQELKREEEENQRRLIKQRREEAMERERLALRRRLMAKLKSKPDQTKPKEEDPVKELPRRGSKIERQSIRQLSREGKQEKLEISSRSSFEEEDEVLQQSISDYASQASKTNKDIISKQLKRSVSKSQEPKLRKTKSNIFDETNHPYAQPLVSKRARPRRRSSWTSKTRLEPLETCEKLV